MKSQNVLEQKQSKSKKKNHPKTNNNNNFFPKKKNLIHKKKKKKFTKLFKWETPGQSNFTTDIEPRRSWWSRRHKQFLHVLVTDRFAILQNLWIPIMSRRVVVRWSDTLFERFSLLYDSE